MKTVAILVTRARRVHPSFMDAFAQGVSLDWADSIRDLRALACHKFAPFVRICRSRPRGRQRRRYAAHCKPLIRSTVAILAMKAYRVLFQQRA